MVLVPLCSILPLRGGKRLSARSWKVESECEVEKILLVKPPPTPSEESLGGGAWKMSQLSLQIRRLPTGGVWAGNADKYRYMNELGRWDGDGGRSQRGLSPWLQLPSGTSVHRLCTEAGVDTAASPVEPARKSFAIACGQTWRITGRILASIHWGKRQQASILKTTLSPKKY